MKKILITYNVSVLHGGALETGEAAAMLDFIPDAVVDELQAKLNNPKYRPNSWKALMKTLTGLEEMRGRVFDKNSVKSIQVVS